MSRSNITTLAYVLSGGEGERLRPLTNDRTKPAVPFGGSYRVIDFVLSNLYHSGIRRILVTTQYESRSLHEHIKYGWYPRFGVGRDEFLDILPPTSRFGGDSSFGYKGTAGSIAENISHIGKNNPSVVDIFGADHVYLMDVSRMNDFHLDNQADLTISSIPVRREVAAKNLGVLVVDSNNRVVGFEEKPENPSPIPGNEKYCFASMGNYAFNPAVLVEELEIDSKKTHCLDKEQIMADSDNLSKHDFGFDVIPAMLKKGRKIFAYNFSQHLVSGAVENERGFWRDIGDLDEYYIANMEMKSFLPPLNLYNSEWPVLTFIETPQPAKFVGMGSTWNSLVANGCIVSGSNVSDSIISYNTRLEGASVIESILLGRNFVGPGAEIYRSILEKDVQVPGGTRIGKNKKHDAARGFTVSPGGITIVPRECKF